MAFAMICDVCKLPLGDRVTSVQILPGRVNGATGGLDLRTVRGAEMFNLCAPCANHVTDHLHHLLNGENVAEMHPDGGSCPLPDPREHLAAG